MPHRQVHLDISKPLGPLTWPMGLTFLRLLLLPVFLWLLLADLPFDPAGRHTYRHAAIAVFVIMAVTDKLDGYLARKLGQASKLGAMLDPVADKLLVAASLVLLSFESIAGRGNAIPIPVVITVYAKDVVLTTGALMLLFTTGRVNIVPRLAGKLIMVIQSALVLTTLLGPDFRSAGESFITPLLTSLQWATIGIAVVASIDYVIQGWQQFADPHSPPAHAD